jgi:DNA helicase-2/ATP-dependent DNA helicase PcrA
MARGSFTSSNKPENDTIIGSPEQKAVWTELDTTERNVVVDAVAGSGKTHLGVEWCKRQKSGRIAFVAFNKHIATELVSRLGGNRNVEAMTYHSLGYKMIRASVGGRVNVDQYKVDGLLDDVHLPLSDYAEKTAKYRIKNLVSLAKQYGVRKRDELEVLVDHHDVDLNGCEEVVYDYVPKILDKCKVGLSEIDFDDMVWLPKELGLSCPKYDTMLIDEAQDTNLSQQWLALNAAKRLVVIGDRNQAIYGFRGSDSQSMQRLEDALALTRQGVIRLPLSVTRRCPRSGVRLAQRIVPQIQALETAIEGSITAMGREQAIASMKPGDMVLCRVNADLLGTAYKLLRMGIKAVVRGRDIGKGLEKLIDRAVKKVGQEDLKDVLGTACDLTADEVGKYLAILHNRGAMRAANAQDRYACLVELAAESQTTSELRGVIVKLFAEFDDDGKPNDAVVCSTVHRGKGLEADKVWVLRPELIPHPMARQKWEQTQERNLAYVTVTRFKKELIWVGGECPLFVDGGEETEGESEEEGEPNADMQ